MSDLISNSVFLPQRPAKRQSSKRKVKKSPRVSKPRENSWSALGVRQEIREKLKVLEHGPYGKKVAGARRPKNEYPDPADLQIALARGKATFGGALPTVPHNNAQTTQTTQTHNSAHRPKPAMSLEVDNLDKLSSDLVTFSIR